MPSVREWQNGLRLGERHTHGGDEKTQNAHCKKQEKHYLFDHA